MMLTRRDLDIIYFLEDYKVASTQTLKELFFPSLSACQKRLKILYDNKRVQRVRPYLNHDYEYFIKKPKRYTHCLLATEFYRELSKQSKVDTFLVDKELGNIRPDAIFGYEINGKKYIGLLEVEISNNGFNYEKYEKFYSSGDYKKFFPVMPTVYMIYRNGKQPQDTKVKYIRLNINLDNFKLSPS